MFLLEFDPTWIIALCTIVPIFVLLIVAFIIALVKRIKMAAKYKKGSYVNEELKSNLLEAYGIDNIENVEVEMSRLTVTVKDVEKVNADCLKQLGANGVLLVGNKVKCSFGEKAEEIYKLLK